MSLTPDRWSTLPVLLGAFAAASFGSVLLVVSLARPRGEESRHAYRPADFPAVFGDELAPVGTESFVVPRPAFDKDMFPCSQCHDNKDLVTKPEPRAKLRDPHETRTVRHGTLWCLSCHDALDRDRLHLADGTLVPLAEPLRLCAQCHAAKARDWESGVHGLRTGRWDGAKRVLPCAACHDPHDPRWKPIDALPPPVRPGFARAERPRKEKP